MSSNEVPTPESGVYRVVLSADGGDGRYGHFDFGILVGTYFAVQYWLAH
jgi:hypothetical protein